MKVTFYAQKYRQSNGWSWIDRFDIAGGKVFRSSNRDLDNMQPFYDTDSVPRPIQFLKKLLRDNYEKQCERPAAGFRGVQVNMFGVVTDHA